MHRDVMALLDGGIGGGLATVGMSLVMLAARKSGLMGRLPPGLISEAALAASGDRHQSEDERDVLAVLLHFGFGIGVGALFGLLRGRLRLPAPAAIQGIVFGSVVWFVSYKGWVPALRIMPPPERDQPQRPAVMLLAHWVYGGLLGLIVSRRQR